MASVDKTFEKLIGRQATPLEVERLHRVRDALGLRDNDALWLILMALESYDTLYRRYPEMIVAQLRSALDEQRSAAATMVELETKTALSRLADAVARGSEAVAVRAVRAQRLQALAVAALALLLFGSLCIFLGFVLGSGRMPYWAPPPLGHSFYGLLWATLAATPAGWLAALTGSLLAIAACWVADGELPLPRRRRLAGLSAALLLASALLAWPLLH